MPQRQEFVRPRRGRVLAGVCAAIADRYGTSRAGVRILFVASLLLPGPQFVVYLLGWAMFPKQPAQLPPADASA
ncbi:MAG: PspC domain-containing protein [Actinomycetes bacterium]